MFLILLHQSLDTILWWLTWSIDPMVWFYLFLHPSSSGTLQWAHPCIAERLHPFPLRQDPLLHEESCRYLFEEFIQQIVPPNSSVDPPHLRRDCYPHATVHHDALPDSYQWMHQRFEEFWCIVIERFYDVHRKKHVKWHWQHCSACCYIPKISFLLPSIRKLFV